jgi:hypothetical protein
MGVYREGESVRACSPIWSGSFGGVQIGEIGVVARIEQHPVTEASYYVKFRGGAEVWVHESELEPA